MGNLRLEVVTPDRLVIETEVESVTLPADNGRLGILANHAPLVAALDIGIVEFGPKQGLKRRLAVSGGFAEMAKNKLTIMANTAELDEEIDVLRAKEAKERAEQRLQERQADWDFVRAKVALRKALTRLKAANRQE